MKKNITASEIYKKQNTLINSGFYRLKMPYAEYKNDWLTLFEEIAGRKVTGLSDLTLLERNRLIQHLRLRGIRLFSPTVPEELKNWKKGDPDQNISVRIDADPQVRMIEALWAELGYERKKLRGMVYKRFGKDDVRFLDEKEISAVILDLQARLRNKGGKYYKREM